MDAIHVFDASTPGQRIYDILEEIGHGSYSEVHAAKERKSGELVALKQLYLSEDRSIPPHIQREIVALQRLSHPNVVRLLDTQQEGFGLTLVLEHCATDLRVWQTSLPDAEPLPAPITKALLRQLLAAVQSCHEAGIWHRDIAPSNILIGTDGAVRLSDFGQAFVLGVEGGPRDCGVALPRTPGVGTRWYKSPEVLLGSRSYDAACDVWAVGAVFGELLLGTPLFPGTSDIDQICRIGRVLGTVSPQVWPGVVKLPDWGKLRFLPAEPMRWAEVCPRAAPEALDLLARFLVYDPDKRCSVTEALASPYFTSDPPPASAADVLATLPHPAD